jgi:Asp-tRNA(Asn)/Glu-tRNA(Gln) amidotransferase A subunit family amidase
MERFFKSYDFLILPLTPNPAFKKIQTVDRWRLIELIQSRRQL